jgi:hypothetical protein
VSRINHPRSISALGAPPPLFLSRFSFLSVVCSRHHIMRRVQQHRRLARHWRQGGPSCHFPERPPGEKSRTDKVFGAIFGRVRPDDGCRHFSGFGTAATDCGVSTEQCCILGSVRALDGFVANLRSYSSVSRSEMTFVYAV